MCYCQVPAKNILLTHDAQGANDQDDRTYDQSFQDEAMRLEESLAEAEEDKTTMAREIEKTATYKNHLEDSLAEAQCEKAVMADRIHSSSIRLASLEQELVNANHALKIVNDEKSAMAGDVVKLSVENKKLFIENNQVAKENARLQKGLADANNTLAAISSSLRPRSFTFIGNASSDTGHETANTDAESSFLGQLTPPSSAASVSP